MRTSVRLVTASVVVMAMSALALAQQPPPEPLTITLVVDEGTNDTLDNMHAQYTPGSHVHLSAIVRDANGQIVQNPQQFGCTPQFQITNNTTIPSLEFPQGQSRAQFTQDSVGDIGGCVQNCQVEFGPAKGVFSVEAHCKERPDITSDHSTAHMLNFETSDGVGTRDNARQPQGFQPQGFQGPQGPQAPQGPGSAYAPGQRVDGHQPGWSLGRKLLFGYIIAVAVAGVVALAVLSTSDSGGGSSLYCFDIVSSTCADCPPQRKCGHTQSECESTYQTVQGICQSSISHCSTTYSANPCSGSVREAVPVRDVDDLVARGFARPGRTTIAAHASQPSPQPARHPSAPTSNTAIWIGVGVAAVSLASTAYAMWLDAGPHPPRVEVVPWATADGGGLVLSGRF